MEKNLKYICNWIKGSYVEADSEEEAIELAIDECPYDNAYEVEPIVEEIENDEE